jgi:hypothetical protein
MLSTPPEDELPRFVISFLAIGGSTQTEAGRQLQLICVVLAVASDSTHRAHPFRASHCGMVYPASHCDVANGSFRQTHRIL